MKKYIKPTIEIFKIENEEILKASHGIVECTHPIHKWYWRWVGPWWIEICCNHPRNCRCHIEEYTEPIFEDEF